MIVHTILVFAELCMEYWQLLLLHQAEWDNLHMQLVSSRYLPFGLLSCFVALQRSCNTTMSPFRHAIMLCSTSAAMWHDITCCTQHWRLPIPCFHRYTFYAFCCKRSSPPRILQLSTLQGLYRHVMSCIDNQRFGSWPTVTPFVQDEGLTGLHISVIPILDFSSYWVLGLLLTQSTKWQSYIESRNSFLSDTIMPRYRQATQWSHIKILHCNLVPVSGTSCQLWLTPFILWYFWYQWGLLLQVGPTKLQWTRTTTTPLFCPAKGRLPVSLPPVGLVLTFSDDLRALDTALLSFYVTSGWLVFCLQG